MGADCIFCRIVSGEIAGHIVLDEIGVLAFLDQKPLFRGHCLVVPRAHVDTLVELPDEQIAPLFSAAKRIAAALPAALGCEGTFVAMNNHVSQSVPHLHVHVVPRRKKDGLKGFFWPRSSYASGEEMAEVARTIRAAIG
jgi:histidine triad (HIT) family protein